MPRVHNKAQITQTLPDEGNKREVSLQSWIVPLGHCHILSRLSRLWPNHAFPHVVRKRGTCPFDIPGQFLCNVPISRASRTQHGIEIGSCHDGMLTKSGARPSSASLVCKRPRVGWDGMRSKGIAGASGLLCHCEDRWITKLL